MSDTRGAEAEGAAKDRSTTTPQHVQQQLLACLRTPWSSLAVVPAQPGTTGRFVAEALADVAWLVRAKDVRVFSAEGLDVAGASKIIVDMVAHVAGGGLAVAIIDPVVARQAGVPIALAADGVLLCVHLGVTELANAKKTVELIGQDKFIGAITVDGSRR